MSKLFKLSFFLGLFILVLGFSSKTYAVSDNASERAKEKVTQAQQFKQYKTTQANALENSKEGTKSARGKEFAMKDNSEKSSKAAEIKKNKLSEARLKVCQAKENVIENRFKALLALGVKTHTGKEKIVERVDNYYNSNLVPSGYTLTNYDALKADIVAKEENVKAILDDAQAAGEEFSCDSDDPKSQTELFKSSIQELIAANKEYKTSVRNFVVAVRNLAKKSISDKISPAVSPVITAPVVSPEVTVTP